MYSINVHLYSTKIVARSRHYLQTIYDGVSDGKDWRIKRMYLLVRILINRRRKRWKSPFKTEENIFTKIKL